MKTAERKITAGHFDIDLTTLPYFATPLVLEAASSQERLRSDTDEIVVIPDYRIDRQPEASDPDLRFGGGLGLAAVLDVGAHPIRARVRGVRVLPIFAITVVAVVGGMMVLFAALRY